MAQYLINYHKKYFYIMGDMLRDIRDSTSYTAKILHEFGSSEVHNSLERIRETATIAQSIIESFKDPQMVKNLESLHNS